MPAPRKTRTAFQALVLPFPRARLGRLDPLRLLPSGRSLALGFALLGLAVGAYVLARETPMFAIGDIEVHGLPADQAAAVRRALAPLQGTSLLALHSSALDRRLGALPELRSFTYDRDFPHTLRVFARSEVPVAVLRRGGESWLVSAEARVLRQVARGALVRLPRIWVPRTVDVSAGATLDDRSGGLAARTLALLPAVRFPARARTIRTDGELTLILWSNLELRLGTERDARLKLEIARRVLPRLDAGVSYLDVSVPERPVAGGNPQPAGRG